MPCVTDISQNEMTRHYQLLLCKACKFLTVEQIESLTNPGAGIYDGLDWYSQHLWLDCTHNVQHDVLHVMDVYDFAEERILALKELNRIGFDIKYCDDKGSTELIKIIETS